MALDLPNGYDSFPDLLPQLLAQGWTIDTMLRYLPVTSLTGLTPTGKAYSVTMQDTTITVVVAGRTKTLTRTKDQWVPGDKALQAIIDCYNQFPANQK